MIPSRIRRGVPYFRVLLGPLIAAGLFTGCNENETTLTDTSVDIGTHSLQMHQIGSGEPSVVIETGIADPMARVSALQERLAEVTHVITYNRAGYGTSEAGPLPRSAVREAEELKLLLDEVAGSSPYVLVGHSLGAFVVQAFAARFPNHVAGLVLLDPPPLDFVLGRQYTGLADMAEQMTTQWQQQATELAQSSDSRERSQSDFFAMIASEHSEMFGESARAIDAIASFGDIPVVVIASGIPNPAFGEVAEEFQAFWTEQSRKLSEKSTQGRFIRAEESSHHIYLDAPDLVTATVLDMVRDFRSE